MKKIGESETLLLAFLAPLGVTLLFFYIVTVEINNGMLGPKMTMVEFMIESKVVEKLVFILTAAVDVILTPLSVILALRYAGSSDLTKPIKIYG